MVYADALYALAAHDPHGPWAALADGMTASALQSTRTMEDAERRGLLPDFHVLTEDRRDGPAINPLTVGKNAARLFGGPDTKFFRCIGPGRWLVHAAGLLGLKTRTRPGPNSWWRRGQPTLAASSWEASSRTTAWNGTASRLSPCPPSNGTRPTG